MYTRMDELLSSKMLRNPTLNLCRLSLRRAALSGPPILRRFALLASGGSLALRRSVSLRSSTLLFPALPRQLSPGLAGWVSLRPATSAPPPRRVILERGEIFFFYRPKVNREEAHSADDVQRMYIVLRPESGERSLEQKQSPDSGKEGAKSGLSPSSSHDDDDDQNGRRKEHPEGGHGAKEVDIEKEPLLRFVVMGRKSLPDPAKKSRPFWGFVELVTTKIDDIKDALQGEEYDTSTRGHRHKPKARALGEGIYRILRHKYSDTRMHTHLVYKLELPPKDKKNEPQEELNVEREGSFIIQIKNPEQQHGGRSEFSGVQRKRKAVFPAHLQGQFGSKRFGAADPPDFLNYEGCEFLLISASDDIEDELGLELRSEPETETEEPDPECSDLVKTFGAETAPTKPLFEGTWC